MVLSKELGQNRTLASLNAHGLGTAYLPLDARAKVLHGLRPGSSMTDAIVAGVLSELDQFLVVDDYGSVECVKYARQEYNKRHPMTLVCERVTNGRLWLGGRRLSTTQCSSLRTRWGMFGLPASLQCLRVQMYMSWTLWMALALRMGMFLGTES